jgi:hypothetical protein
LPEHLRYAIVVVVGITDERHDEMKKKLKKLSLKSEVILSLVRGGEPQVTTSWFCPDETVYCPSAVCTKTSHPIPPTTIN